MIFNKYKKAKVAYSIDNTYTYPQSLFPEPYMYNKNTYGCPAVKTTNNRLFAINGPLDIKYTYNPQTNNLEHERTSGNTASAIGDDVHKYINVSKQVINNVITLQASFPYVFFTDTKDIEITLLPGTDLKMENCNFISGSFNIYNWARVLNFAIEVNDTSKLSSFEFNIDKPVMFVLFNKPIDLSYKVMNDDMWNMISQVKNISYLRNNIEKIYNTVLSRRPKNIL